MNNNREQGVDPAQSSSMAVSRTRSIRIWVLVTWALFVLPPLALAQTGLNTTDEPEDLLGQVDSVDQLDTVVVQASVDQNEITIGDPIRYTLTVTAETNVDVQVPVFSDRLGDFDIIDFGELPSRSTQDPVITARWYALTIFTTGYHIIPAPSVPYTTADGAKHTAQGGTIRIHVASLLTQEGQITDIRDIKPPEEVPFDWRPYILGGVILIALVLLGAALFYFLNRFRRAADTPRRPAHEIALQALTHLRAQHLPQAGQVEAYYVALSGIVRMYLEDGLQLRAPEMTTEEFLLTVSRDTGLTAPQQRLLGKFLSQADLVKFARYVPSLDDSDAAYTAARRFIDETRPSESDPVSDAPSNALTGSRAGSLATETHDAAA